MAKKVVSIEIKDVETRQDQLKKTSEMLQSDFVKFVKEAKEKQDLALFSKAIAMKQKVDEKNEEIKSLEQILGILEQKRKSLKLLYPEYVSYEDSYVYIFTFTLFKTDIDC